MATCTHPAAIVSDGAPEFCTDPRYEDDYQEKIPRKIVATGPPKSYPFFTSLTVEVIA